MSRPRAEDLERLPHFIYMHLDDADRVIYVGLTTDPTGRPRDARKRPWIKTESRRIELSSAMPHAAAVWVEAMLIRHLNPTHNTQRPRHTRSSIDWRVLRIAEAEGVPRSTAEWAVRYYPTDPAEFEARLAKRVAALAP